MSDSDVEMKSTDNNVSQQRRKRINRLKSIIVGMVILLLALQTFFCFLFGFQIYKLRHQVRELMSLHSQYDLANDETEDEDHNLAYAAEKLPVAPTASPSIIPEETNRHDPEAETSDVEEQSMTDTAADIASDNASEDAATQEEADTEQKPSETGKPDDLAATGVNNTDNEETVIGDLNAGDSSAAGTEEMENTDNAAAAEETESTGIYAGKQVYLTFDDGPSKNTGEILDILKEYDVKATFFVIGKTDKTSKKLYKRIVDEGHTLGMHSYSHKYDIIYNSVEDFDKDFTKLWNLLYDTTGYKPTIYRFPGGSDNGVNKHGMEDFIRYLNKAGISYYDWNVLNGDATGIDYTEEQLIANVLNGVAAKKRSIVLMHDTASKTKTVETLPDILEKLISGGAQILPIDKSVKPIQMIKADSVK